MDERTRRAKAEGHVSEFIHRYAAHPAPVRVRLVGALLKDGHRSGRHAAKFEPADARHIVRLDGIVSDQRFVSIAESAIGQPIHQAVTNAVQSVTNSDSQLRHAVASRRAESRKASGNRAREESKGRVCWCDKVDVKVVYVVHTGYRPFHVRVRRAGRRLFLAVQVGGQKWRVIGAQWWEGNEGSWLAGQHHRAIERERLRTEKCRAG